MDEPLEIEEWRKISVLGSGAFGVVSLWKHEKQGDCIAIKKCKFVNPNHLTPKQKLRWQNEVQIIKNLQNDNIVSFKKLPEILEHVLQRYNPSELPILSMEYCTKGNLRHVLNQASNSSGLLEKDVREVLSDIVGAVSYLHQYKITHRDIKPENIVLQERNSRASGVIYKLIDLGYAKEISDSNVSFVGTLHYLAPEIMRAETYNYSVDYWSLGILCFEIVCGILPFLPQFTPLKRFEYIEAKKPEHICIHEQRSGSIVYKSEVLKENHISLCLKHDLEKWLRHVLSFDPKQRSGNMPCGRTVFEFMDAILSKQIVTVFSVYTMEFYSYEINENTFVSTLKDWIGRDIKVPIQDQLLFTTSSNITIQDNEFVINLLTEVDQVLYVFKRGSFIKRTLTKQPPHNITFLFDKCKERFRWRILRPLYTKALFYLVQNAKTLSFTLKAFDIYLHQLDEIIIRLQKQVHKVHSSMSDVLKKIRCYCNIRNEMFKDVIVNNSEKYSLLLSQMQELLHSVKEGVTTMNKLLRKSECYTRRGENMKKILPKIKVLIASCDIDKGPNEATHLLCKGPDEIKSDMSCKEMVNVISNVWKDQDRFLQADHFINYTKHSPTSIQDLCLCSRALALAYQRCHALLVWTKEFCQYIDNLDSRIDKNQSEQYRSIFTQIRDFRCPVNSDSQAIIDENYELRQRMNKITGDICDGLGTILHGNN